MARKSSARSRTSEPRPYRSSLREEQASQTRERILETLTAALSRGEDDIPPAALALEAGVSLRTVYHHFPNREALFDALAAWVDARILASEQGPRGAADLPSYASRLLRQALANEELTRATLAPGVAEKIRGLRRRTRLAAIDKAVGELGAPARDAKLVAALLKHLLSADTGVALIDRYAVAREDLPGLMAWATDALTNALQRSGSCGTTLGAQDAGLQ